jgi:hypothetical protein
VLLLPRHVVLSLISKHSKQKKVVSTGPGMQLLYITFLAEFFSDDEGLDMDMMYYSEMKDAGYFDDSYEEF